MHDALKNTEAINSLNILQLGALPHVEMDKNDIDILQKFSSDNESIFSESIRSCRAVVESKFNKNKSFLITSSNPSEGKTTFAFNLSLVIRKVKYSTFYRGRLKTTHSIK